MTHAERVKTPPQILDKTMGLPINGIRDKSPVTGYPMSVLITLTTRGR